VEKNEAMQGMAMKRIRFISAALLAACILVFTGGCGSTGGGGKGSGSEVLVRRVDNNDKVKLKVFIDGKSAGNLKVGSTSRFKVKNGTHTIYATAYDYMSRSTEVSSFNSNNSRHIFSITDTSVVFIGEEPINMAGATVVSTPRMPGVGSIDMAVQAAWTDMEAALKKNKAKRLAIINIASDNRAEGNYVIEELTYLAVNSKTLKKIQVLDRRKIESIRIAKNFDRTSDMEDDFVLSIGSLLGADTVITGSLNGSGELRRFRAKAIDVTSGQIIAMSIGKI
jgi:hypothetical protein